MTEKQFYTDGKYVMQKGEVWVVAGGEHSADVIATALNELIEERNKLQFDYNMEVLARQSVEKEKEELKKEKEFWKGDACNCSNYLSILSMDCQIVQEAICDLYRVIDVDTEAFRLLDELDDKFDNLVQHRIKMYSR